MYVATRTERAFAAEGKIIPAIAILFAIPAVAISLILRWICCDC